MTDIDVAAALAADEARRKAMMAADTGTLAELLADDCLYIHSSGHIDTKQSYLAQLADGTLRYHSLAAEEVRAITLGPVVILTHQMHAEATVGGKPRSIHAQAAAVWQAVDGRPRLVYFQNTTLPPE